MKKVMLSAAALMIGAIGFAQVSGAPEATSQDPTVVPNNSANTQANKGKSEQFGNDHRVRVRQAGTKQSVYTMQADGSGTIGANRAEILQSGTINTNSGRKNAADVYQSGDENLSLTIQEGDRNNAITRQGQTDDASARNQAFIRQGNNGNAEDNYAAIDQDGEDNQAKTIQTYDNNDAYTDQDGDNLRSRIQQIAAPDGSEGHWAFVDQQGDGSESWVLQEGAGARNYAHTAQDGESNYADQYQTTQATSGDANRARIAQGINVPYTTVGFNSEMDDLRDDTYDVDGTPHNTSLFSKGAQAFQRQDGDDNQANIGQYGVEAFGIGNYAYQNQEGDDNNSFIVQDLFGPSNGGGNKAQQMQDGDDNNAGIVQSGKGHKAGQFQYGDDNIALTSQKGKRNKAFTFQYGDDNWVSTAQRGHDNKIVVSQYDGQSYIAEQNLIHHPQAGGNQIDVVQTDGSQSINDWLAEECEIDMLTPQTWTGTPSPSTPDICADCN
ncbi:MAG: curlin [Bacteroidota bacterium]